MKVVSKDFIYTVYMLSLWLCKYDISNKSKCCQLCNLVALVVLDGHVECCIHVVEDLYHLHRRDGGADISELEDVAKQYATLLKHL